MIRIDSPLEQQGPMSHLPSRELTSHSVGKEGAQLPRVRLADNER